MAKTNLKKVLNYQPKVWGSTNENYLSTSEVPYLKKLVSFLIQKSFNKDQILEAWGLMLGMKAEQKPIKKEEKNRVYLEDALHAFFAPVDYHHTKQHYAALVELMG